MTHKRIVAVLALAFALGVGISFVNLSSDPSASASENTEDSEVAESESTLAQLDETPIDEGAGSPSQTDIANVSTTEDFLNAVADESVSTIILNADLQVTVNITRTAPLVIDLNAHTIRPSATGGSYTIRLSRGHLTIVGNDTPADSTHNGIYAVGNNILVSGSTDPSDANYSTLTIGSNVQLYSMTAYAVAVVPYNAAAQQYQAYGVTVNMNGIAKGGYGVHVNGFIKDEYNRPKINIGSTAQLLNDDEQEDSTPIYAAGTADWTIGAAVLRGKSGLGIKSGTFTFNGTDISIDGVETTPTPSGSGITGTSCVFQLEHHSAYTDNVVLNIHGGEYRSANSNVFYEYGQITNPNARTTSAADINITDGFFVAGTNRGVFGGTLEDGQANIDIAGGTFQGTDLAKIKNYLPSNLTLTANGTVMETLTPNPAGEYTLSRGPVSVTGKFDKNNLILEAAIWGANPDNIFGDKPNENYTLTVYDGTTKLDNLPAGMRVSIEVPETIDGTKAQVYALSPNYGITDSSVTVTKINSTYKNGVVTFTTDTLGGFAIVEEPTQSNPTRPGSSSSNAAVTKPDNSNDSNSSDSTDGSTTPATGALRNTGIGSAVSVAAPVLGAICIITLACGKKLFSSLKSARMAHIDCEITTEAAEAIEEEPEPVIERFVATKIDRDDPEYTSVDSFIPSK